MSEALPAATDNLAVVSALDFEPWPNAEGEWTPPTNEEWAQLANPHLVSVRLAWLTLHKSKAELIAAVDELGDDGLQGLVEGLAASADWFRGLHEMLAAAECRLLCAAAASCVASPDGGAEGIGTSR